MDVDKDSKVDKGACGVPYGRGALAPRWGLEIFLFSMLCSVFVISRKKKKW